MPLRRSLLVALVAGIVGASGCVGQSRREGGASPLVAKPVAEAGAGTVGVGAVSVSVLGPKGIHELEVTGEKQRVAVSVVKPQGQPFGDALRVEIKEKSSNPWDVQLQARTTSPVAKGDVLLATFYFRTDWTPAESGEGQTEFVFELAREPWGKSASFAVRAAREWKKIQIPFVAEQSYAAGEAQMILRLGYEPERIELGGLTVESFGTKVALSALPVTKVTYPGMELDAPWRAAAAARIDKLRKAELRVVVKDRAGKVVPNADVTLRLTKHAFGFGSCVPAHLLVGPEADEKVKALLPELFNTATLENDLKWQPLAGDWGAAFNLERAQAGVAWLRAHGLAVRGHVLVWPGWKNLPKALRDDEKDPVRLGAEVTRHISELVGATKGSLVHWDVVNEPFDNHDLLDILGNDAMLAWFKAARAADPAPKLFINDYAILSGGGGTTPHRDAYDQTIERLVKAGAPFDGIGLQGHFGSSLTGPEDLLKILDRFARFGKTIWVTEYDIVLDDRELAGRFTRDFYTTLFSHPAVGGIVMWGFWDGSHWKSNAPLYEKDWSPKPAERAYRELVLGEWSTRAQGKTAPSGAFSARGTFGEYEVTALAGSRRGATRATLGPKGASVAVILD